jgi:23S rRNA pseudouridine2457 synthase
VILAFYKPFGVLSQFTQEHPSHRVLAEFGFPPRTYAIGRLDRDSEGLLLLSDESQWNDRLLNPRHAHPRTYHAQVEGEVTPGAIAQLQGGLDLGDFKTQRCHAMALDPEPVHPPRDPPIRYRKSVPTSWISLTLTEGKNRQVRRMTAAVGHPTLRLVRTAIGTLTLDQLRLAPGEWRELNREEHGRILAR